MTRFPTLFGLILLGCDNTPPTGVASEVSSFAAILAHRPPQVEDDLAACALLSQASLAQDCALQVALFASADLGTPLEALCPQVPEGTARQECWFQAAEGAVQRDQDADAARLCTQTGPYEADCALHLWGPQLRPLAAREDLGAAQALHAAWAPLLPGHDQAFWQHYFEQQAQGRVDLARCPGSGPLKLRCEAALSLTYARRVWRLDGPLVNDFCRLDHLDVREAQRRFGLRARPHPRLQEALDLTRTRRCTGGPSPDDSGSWGEEAVAARLKRD